MLVERKTNSRNYLATQSYRSGLLTGLLAGLAVGFLFAPRSGSALRRLIAGTVSDKTEEIQHQWDKNKAQVRETIDNIKTNVGLMAGKADNKAHQMADNAKSGIGNVQWPPYRQE